MSVIKDLGYYKYRVGFKVTKYHFDILKYFEKYKRQKTTVQFKFKNIFLLDT